LVVGATGQVGSHLLAALAASGATVVGTGHRTAADVRLDLADAHGIADVLNGVQPDTVWLAGAYTHVDGCEVDPEASHRVNVAGPTTVAAWARDHGARLVFFSTDYVFDGTAGPYVEDADPHPLSVYGRDKLAIEALLAAELPDRALVVRTTWVYGRAARGQGFIERLTQNLAAGRSVRLPSDQWGNPTSAANLAHATHRLWAAGAVGVWHVAGPDYIPRADWGRQVAAYVHGDPSLIEGVSTAALEQPAARPLAGGLLATRAATFLGISFWDGATGLAHLASSPA
jgi:dTDP-4-dehydrorhamnose reductase